jgi:hypothetical protein
MAYHAVARAAPSGLMGSCAKIAMSGGQSVGRAVGNRWVIR